MSPKEVRLEEVLDLLETNKRLLSQGNQKKMLQFLLDEAIRMTGAERGFIVFPNLEVVAARSIDQETLKKAQEKFSKTVFQQVMETGKPLHSMDAEKDERLKEAQSVMEMNLRSILCVPIRAEERSLGVLYLDNRFTEGAFQENQVRLVQLFADQAALALSLIDSLEEREKLQQQLALLNETLREKVERMEQERDRAQAQLGAADSQEGFAGIVAISKPMRKVLHTIRQIQDAEVSVYIHGESGTGKELIARALHQNSPRRRGPFLAINCAAFSEQLLDSELFGHVRGAFTGAERERRGLFEEAGAGTLFLDEVGEMSPAMQAKLLRVLQEREIRPVGSNISKKIDVRVLCASNKDLKEMVRAGKFREDLYYRLNVLRLDLPPLRERPEDIPPLLQHFIQHNPLGLPREFLSLEDAALHPLLNYSWPGNIRELQNEIHRCLILGKGQVREQDLSPQIREKSVPLGKPGGKLEEQLEQLEKRMLIQALEEVGGNKTEAAAKLGISRIKLYQLIRRHGLAMEFGKIRPAKVRRVLREVRGNKTLAARRLGIGRKTLYDYLEKMR